MVTARDQIGRIVKMGTPAKAIVSLVPSLTDLLSRLQLDECVVGITKFCVHPASWKSKKVVVGGTKQFHFSRIEKLSPDLIIANKEENTKGDIDVLAENYAVYISDIKSLSDCYQCILDIGTLTNRREESIQLINDIKEAFNSLNKSKEGQKVAYCIWKDPWMFAGNDTFIDHMLVQAGLLNAVQQPRYPSIAIAEIAELKPDFLFLSSEPFPFGIDHIKQLTDLLPNTKITLVDGELFSWYGSSVLKFPAYINSLLEELKTSK
ncbi:MAG: ABC-type Fe3+-hydroxamate transport system substrate-binding protein [Marivirga sp.]|jgi:ABC-type Fe3+-hydroxamate transport system substrate-binding protein